MNTLVRVDHSTMSAGTRELFIALVNHFPLDLITELDELDPTFFEVYGPEGHLLGVEARVGDPAEPETVWRFEPLLAATIEMHADGRFRVYRQRALIKSGDGEELDLLERQVLN